MCSGLPSTERGAIDRLSGRTPCPFLHSTTSFQSRFGSRTFLIIRRVVSRLRCATHVWSGLRRTFIHHFFCIGARAIELRDNILMP